MLNYSVILRVQVALIMKGEVPFGYLFDHVPVESHGLNNTTSTVCKHKIKQPLMGRDSKTWHVEDNFTTEMLFKSSVSSTNKLAPNFFQRRVTERNIKKMCAEFSLMIGGKQEHMPSTDNDSGTTCEDYFVMVMANVAPKIR